MTDQNEARRKANELAQQYRDRGDYTGWFEALYANADASIIPWAEMKPNAGLDEWLRREQLDGQGKTAVVIGCGLGDDAEAVARHGFMVTAFDISASAIEWCKRRWQNTSVNYTVGDLLSPPDNWHFDFVFELYTIQALPLDVREKAITCAGSLVAPGGRLLAIGRLAEPEAERKRMPWPLTRAELHSFERAGLTETRFEDYYDGENPPVHRFRVEYRK